MGILQVPFFACQLILVKYATALHDNKSILLSAVIGLILNIVFDIALMKWMNVWGIALATSIAVLGSAVVLLFRLHRQGNMSWLDILFAITSWMLFITMMLCMHFESYSGVYATGLALVLSIYLLAKEGKNTTGILQLGARKNIQ
jgi:peptidoglycan biosynthesis protein MviN/MurJ (putative lipid II flippase)